MPIRGENIGTAYVRIVGDGSGLPDDVRDAFDDAEPSVREGARKHGDSYDDEFAAQLRKNFRGSFGKTKKEIVEGLDNSLRDAMARIELSKRFFDSPEWKRFTTRLEVEGGAAGRLFAKRLADRFRDSGNLEDLEKAIRDVGPGIRRAQREVLVEIHEDALRMNREFDANIRRQAKATEKSITDVGDSFDRQRAPLLRFFDTYHRGLIRMRDGNRVFADTLGRLTGRGARNDFVNFIGSLTRGMTLMIGGLIRGFVGLGRIITKPFTAMIEAMQSAEEAGQSLGRVVSSGIAAGLMSVGSSAGIALGVMAAAAAALILVIGPLVALLSMLLGIVTALAASLSFALMSAFIGLVGVALPLVAVIGGAALAFTNMDAETKKLIKEGIKPLKEEFKELQGVLQDHAFRDLDRQLRRVSNVLDGMRPLFAALGDGVRMFANALLDSIESPAFDKFVNSFSDFLPGAMRRFGVITGNVLEGMGGVIRGMLPAINRFLNWLIDITDQFSDWANSARGQREMREFWRDVEESAESVWGFLEQIGGLIADLFSGGGKDTGDNIFDDMANAIEGFRESLSEADIEKWFEDAERTATALGEIVVALGKITDTLDNPATRGAVTGYFGAWSAIIGGANAALEGFMGNLQRVKDFFSGDSGAFSGGGGLQMIQLPKPGDLLAPFIGLGDRIGKAIGKVDVSGMISGAAEAAGGVVGSFVGTASRVFGKVKTNVSGMISGAGQAVSRLIGTFTGTAGRVFDRVKTNVSGMITNATTAVTGLLNSFSGMPGRVLDKVRTNVSGMITGAGEAADKIVEAFRGVRDRILDLIGGAISIGVNIDWPSPPGWLDKVTASGGIFAGAQARIIGEAGPEAVVPLHRPLDQVDPSVRWLSAIAQGKTMAPTMSGGGRSVTVGELHVHAPVTDPFAAARLTVDQLAATGY
jgi:hypothetical protein